MQQPGKNSQPVPHLESKRESLTARREELIADFSSLVRSGSLAESAHAFREIQLVGDFLESLQRIASETVPRVPAGINRYAVSSLFLHECFHALTADSREQLFFVTGSIVTGVNVLNQRIEFEHQKRSILGVTGDEVATHRALIKLEQFGHRLLGHFHSHPGSGAEATLPSGTDENFQARLERAGHVAVAAIFSRDGYVRFFRIDKNLQVDVYGAGVVRHDSSVVQLTNLDKA
ncbi:MAG: hypothetical protein ABFD89_03210 [Bryobacteraceae bacterium]